MGWKKLINANIEMKMCFLLQVTPGSFSQPHVEHILAVCYNIQTNVMVLENLRAQLFSVGNLNYILKYGIPNLAILELE